MCLGHARLVAGTDSRNKSTAPSDTSASRYTRARGPREGSEGGIGRVVKPNTRPGRCDTYTRDGETHGTTGRTPRESRVTRQINLFYDGAVAGNACARSHAHPILITAIIAVRLDVPCRDVPEFERRSRRRKSLVPRDLRG